jgi:hypothetical protein
MWDYNFHCRLCSARLLRDDFPFDAPEGPFTPRNADCTLVISVDPLRARLVVELTSTKRSRLPDELGTKRGLHLVTLRRRSYVESKTGPTSFSEKEERESQK